MVVWTLRSSLSLRKPDIKVTTILDLPILVSFTLLQKKERYYIIHFQDIYDGDGTPYVAPICLPPYGPIDKYAWDSQNNDEIYPQWFQEVRKRFPSPLSPIFPFNDMDCIHKDSWMIGPLIGVRGDTDVQVSSNSNCSLSCK